MTSNHNFRDSSALCHRNATHNFNTISNIRTNSENIRIKYNFTANAIDISSNSLAALAGSGGLHIIQLHSPFVPTINMFHHTGSTVSHVKFHGNSSLIASTSGSCVLLYDLLSSRNPTLAFPSNDNVTGISWSPSDESVLAVCLRNGNSVLWDARIGSESPILNLPVCQPSTASQVEWNPSNTHEIAIVQNGGVNIWDTRQVHTQPSVRLGDPHQLINRMDWHPRAYQVITCSEDALVQLWDVMQPISSRGCISISNPVTDIAYTPFGNGFLTKSMGEGSYLRLWKIGFQDTNSYSAKQIHFFIENRKDVIDAFAWRSLGGNKFQIVSLINHNELSLRNVDPQHVLECDIDGSYKELSSSFEGLYASPSPVQSPGWDISILKNDLASVVSATGYPIAAEEYKSSWPNHPGCILLEDETIKNDFFEPRSSLDEHGSEYNLTEEHRLSFSDTDRVSNSRLETQMSTSARSLPCPRIHGASFSGPNMLVMFDSRIAIGQSRVNTGSNSFCKRKNKKACESSGEENNGKKKQINANHEYLGSNSLPRTYGELLVYRDARFMRKNQTLTSSLSVAANLASMDLGASSERGIDNLMDYTFGADENDFMHTQSCRMVASTGQFPGKNAASEIARTGDFEYTAFKDSTSKKNGDGVMRYSDDLYHNTPSNQSRNPLLTFDHHKTPYGLGSTPQFVPRNHRITDRLAQQKRVLDAPSSSNWSLSLRVTLVDLSRLCGVTAVLMYETCLSPEALLSHNNEHVGTRPLKGKKKELLLTQWIHDQQSCQREMPSNPTRPTSLNGFWHNVTNTSVNSSPFERVCSYNAQIATLGGRPDLCKVWTLLGSVCAAPIYLSLYKEKYERTLNVSESWKHHPFGLPLINRLLQMYEQVGDLPSLASLVCVLENENGINKTVPMHASVDRLNEAFRPVDPMNDVNRAGALLPVEGSHRSSSFGEIWRNKLAKHSNSTSSTGGGLPLDSRLLSSIGSGASPTLSPHSPSFISLLAMKESHLLHNPPDQLSKPSGAPTGSWKLEFEKLENPFRTWSAGIREMSPPRVSAQTALRLAENAVKPPTRSKILTSALSSKQNQGTVLHLRLQIIPKNENEALMGGEFSRHAIYKGGYADVLYRYGAISRRTEILKERALTNEAHVGIHFGILCWRCQTVRYLRPANKLFLTLLVALSRLDMPSLS